MKVVLVAMMCAVMLASTVALFAEVSKEDIEVDCEKMDVQKGDMSIGRAVTKEQLVELRVRNLLARMRSERGRRIQLAQNWFSKNDHIQQGEK